MSELNGDGPPTAYAAVDQAAQPTKLGTAELLDDEAGALLLVNVGIPGAELAFAIDSAKVAALHRQLGIFLDAHPVTEAPAASRLVIP